MSIVKEVKSELKPSKIIVAVVMFLVAGAIVAFLSKRFPQVAALNKVETK